MKTRLSIITILSMVLCITACEKHTYYDSYTIKGDVVSGYSEGKKFEIKLDYFKLLEKPYSYNDTITLDDEVVTSSTGFTPCTATEFISSRFEGNFEVRRCVYKSAFEIYINSYAHQSYTHYLPFEFEAEEVLLDGKTIARPPFIFFKDKTTLEEIALKEDQEEEFHSHYLLTFPLSVYNKYNRDSISIKNFNYCYDVIRNKKSVWNDTPDVVITVTYNWTP